MCGMKKATLLERRGHKVLYITFVTPGTLHYGKKYYHEMGPVLFRSLVPDYSATTRGTKGQSSVPFGGHRFSQHSARYSVERWVLALKMPGRRFAPSRWPVKQTGLARGGAAARQNGGARRSLAVGRARGQSAVTSFNETKYFDCGINTVVTWAGTDWSDSEIPCDNYVNSSGAAAAYTDSCLVPTAIGSAYGEVNGNRYKLKKIRVRGNILVPVAADQADVLNPTYVRLMLIHDEQPNGAQAQGEDVMQDIGAAGENLYSYKRVASTSGRFRILKDQFYVLDCVVAGTDGTNTNSVGTEGVNFSFQYQPNSPILVNVKSGSSTPTIASTVNCNMFLVVAGTRLGSAVAVTIRAASRAYYVD